MRRYNILVKKKNSHIIVKEFLLNSSSELLNKGISIIKEYKDLYAIRVFKQLKNKSWKRM